MVFKAPLTQQVRSAFTLTELLIVLVLLGVIASIAVPKILHSAGDTKDSAIMKEAVYMLEDSYYQKRNVGLSISQTNVNLYDYIIEDLNVLNSGTGAPPADATNPGSTCADSTKVGNGWIRLQSGVTITGLNGPATPSLFTKHTLCIDPDGTSNGAQYIANFQQGPLVGGTSYAAFRWGNDAVGVGDIFQKETGATLNTGTPMTCTSPPPDCRVAGAVLTAGN